MGLILLAPQMMGGAFDWSVVVIAAGALLALGLSLARAEQRRTPVPPVLWAAFGAAVWTAFQLVPLGHGLANALSPERATVHRLLTHLLGTVPTSATSISLDWGATQLELLKGSALLCAFIASYLTSRRGHDDRLLMAVSASGALMAVVALSHRAVDAHTVFGLYRWEQASPRLPAPILNDNCLAGLMVLTAPVALGLAMSTDDARVRTLQYVSAFVIVVTGVLAGSRAGTGAMVFALGAMVLAIRLRRRTRTANRLAVNVTAFVVAAGLAVAVLVGAEPLLRSLNQDDFSKLQLVEDAFALALHHPWLGVGRGAFSAAMTPLMTDNGRFVHAENFVATWLSEWGIPLGLLLLLTLGHGLLRLLSETKHALLGAGIGLLAFGAQNLLDLATELSGIAVVAAALLGTGLGAINDERSSDTPSRVPVHGLGLGTFVCSTAVLIWVAPGALADGDNAFLSRLQALRTAGRSADFAPQLARALAVHPFEPVYYLSAGGEAVDRRDPKALRWLNLAMLRAPRWSAPHAEAARLLLSLGRPGQAALEAREATKLNVAAGARTACAVARQDPRIEHVILAQDATTAVGKEAFLDAAARCLPAPVLRSLDQHLIDGGKAPPTAVLREYQRLANEGNRMVATQLLIDATNAGASEEPSVLLALARALISEGDVAGATQRLERARKAGAEPSTLDQVDAEIAAARGDAPAMRAVIERLRASGAGSGRKLAEVAQLRAKLEARLGNFAEATAAYDEAVELDPNVSVLRAALAYARTRQNTAKQARLKRLLCDLSPTAAECRERSP